MRQPIIIEDILNDGEQKLIDRSMVGFILIFAAAIAYALLK